MTERSGDPHQIQAELEEVEEYQAPPREHEQEAGGDQPSSGADEHVDLSLLEAQQGRHKPEMSETKTHPKHHAGNRYLRQRRAKRPGKP